MATAIIEKPMASAIVTAQTEIHMIGPHDGSPPNALMGIWFPLAGTNVGTKQAMNAVNCASFAMSACQSPGLGQVN
jgi:hypothetical protein